MKDLVNIPFHGGSIVATVGEDGKPLVALKPVCEAIGLNYSGQLQRLKRQPWAEQGMVVIHTPSAGGVQETNVLDRQTFTMWLATIETSRLKNEDAKQLLVAYQKEAAAALDQYFHEGGVINPRATDHQVKALFYDHMHRIELLQAAKGLVHPDYLEAKARIVISESDGTLPELDPLRKPLAAQDFLKEKGAQGKRLRSIGPNFGKRLKKLYIEKYGVEPMQTTKDIRGHFTTVYAYTEADRPLMEQVWQAHYSAAPTLEVIA